MCHREGSVLDLGPSSAGIPRSLSPDRGAEFASYYEDGSVTVQSTLTAEVVCVSRTFTSRFDVGCQSMAWACPEGIKAIHMSAPHMPVWAFKTTDPYRFAFGPNDTLVVFQVVKEIVRATCVNLSVIGPNFPTCTTRKTGVALAPDNISPITVTPQGYASCVFTTQTGSAVAYISEMKPYSCAAKTHPISFNSLTRGDLVETGSTIVAKTMDARTYALVKINDTNMRNKMMFVVYHDRTRVTLDAGESACFAPLSNGNCMLGIRGKPLVVATPMDENNRIMFKDIHTMQQTQRNRLRFGKERRCDKCRRYVRGGDCSGLTTCDACSERGSLAHCFGVAMRYAYNRYQFLPSKMDTRTLLFLFRKHPCCVITRTSYKQKKLVYVKIDESKKASALNMMLIRQDQAQEEAGRAITRMAERWALEAFISAQEGL